MWIFSNSITSHSLSLLYNVLHQNPNSQSSNNSNVLGSLHKPLMVEYDGPKTASLGSLFFTLFNELPIEIRLQIWTAALPGPRVINIREKRPAGQTKDEEDDNDLFLSSDSKAPSMLFACKESRDVALEYYTPRFALKKNPQNILRLQWRYLVFTFRRVHYSP